MTTEGGVGVTVQAIVRNIGVPDTIEDVENEMNTPKAEGEERESGERKREEVKRGGRGEKEIGGRGEERREEREVEKRGERGGLRSEITMITILTIGGKGETG